MFLGVNSIEPVVSGKQTEITRKSFSELMRNCPTFYGQLQTSLWLLTLGTQIFTEKQNDIKTSFTPKNGVLDSYKTIAKLDSVQPDNDLNGLRYTFDGGLVNVTTLIIGSSQDIEMPL